MFSSFKLWVEADNPILNFGVHRGKTLEEVPEDYLRWLLSGKFTFNPGNIHLKDAIQKELSKRELPKRSPISSLQQLGLSILGGLKEKPLDTIQIQRIANEIKGREAFPRNQFYSEAVLPNHQPGWIAFSFYGEEGVISLWEKGKNFSGHNQLGIFLKEIVNKKYENRDQELEDFLFSYNKPDVREFDKAREERRNFRDRWDADIRKVDEFIEGALRFWYSKVGG